MAVRAKGNVTFNRRGLSKRFTETGLLTFAAGVAGGIALMVLATHGAPAFAVLPSAAICVGVYFGLLLLLIGAFTSGGRKLGASTVSIEGDALRIEGARRELVVPRRSIQQGTLEQPSGVVLEDDRGREIHLEVGTTDGALLLAELGLDPSRRRLAFAWHHRPTHALTFFGALATSAVLATLPLSVDALVRDGTFFFPLAILFLTPTPIAALAARWASRRELIVGLDGVTLSSRRAKRTIRFADVADARVTDRELVLVLNDGRSVKLVTREDGDAPWAAIASRVLDAKREARARMADEMPIAGLLVRSGRSVSEWRAAVARMSTAASGFRDARLSVEQIARVVEDPSAGAEQRLAAAMALGATGDADQLARVRAAASACAVPELRIALGAAADGTSDDDASIEAALREDEEDEDEPARRARV